MIKINLALEVSLCIRITIHTRSLYVYMGKLTRVQSIDCCVSVTVREGGRKREAPGSILGFAKHKSIELTSLHDL